METPTSQGRPQSLPQRLFDASMPALVELYAHKPLPPLPPTSHPKRMTTSRPTTPMRQRDLPCTPRAAGPGSSEPAKPRRATTPSSPRSHPHRISYSGLSAKGRCSYHKIQQLTGHDIDVMDDCPVSRPSVDSDMSSNYSQKWDGDYSLVPLLEADNGDTSSRGSSWAPTSPQSPLVPAPLNITKPAILHGSDPNLADNYASDAHIALEDELAARRWDPTCGGHFSDNKTAGEYHRIATELAARVPSHASREASALPAPTRRKRLSLSAGFAVPRFSRRRNTSHLVGSTVPPRAAGNNTTPYPLEGRLTSQLSSSPALVSAFDSDSSDDEKTTGSGIWEWFGRRSERHDDSRTRASTGEHMRGLLNQAKDRAKRLHGSNEEGGRSRELRRRHSKTV